MKTFRFSNNRKFNGIQLIYCVLATTWIYIWTIELNEVSQIMKTNFYILFILLLSFSAIGAQNEVKTNNVETNVTVFEANEATVIIDTVKIKEAIAKSSSDIRIFLNRERKVDNIKLVFPKINKRKLS
ncbi:hypothetical protein [Jejuia pallidilutea]|nr:hypothetical protein [Jejuia pallidilutea]